MGKRLEGAAARVVVRREGAFGGESTDMLKNLTLDGV